MKLMLTKGMPYYQAAMRKYSIAVYGSLRLPWWHFLYSGDEDCGRLLRAEPTVAATKYTIYFQQSTYCYDYSQQELEIDK